MPDVYLWSVPSDSDPDDVRLRDPTTGASGSDATIDLNGFGIATAEAFGTASVQAVLNGIGIATAEAFGTDSVVAVVSAVGIATGEAVGSPSVVATAGTVGIGSGEAFGAGSLVAVVSPVGIASAEAFGTPVVGDATISLVGIASAEAFGVLTVDDGLTLGGGSGKKVRFLGHRQQAPKKPAKQKRVELPRGEPHWLLSDGIESAEAFGVPVVDPQPARLGVAGAKPTGGVGTPRLDANPMPVDLRLFGIAGKCEVGEVEIDDPYIAAVLEAEDELVAAGDWREL